MSDKLDSTLVGESLEGIAPPESETNNARCGFFDKESIMDSSFAKKAFNLLENGEKDEHRA